MSFLMNLTRRVAHSKRATERLLTVSLTCLALTAPNLHEVHAAPPQSPAPLPAAHAHNDYEHDHPLLDALDHGFCNVEADVFLVGSDLLVGHDKPKLSRERTLEALYLAPLQARAEANGGQIFRDGPRLTLFIDFKTDGPATYAALAKLLRKYEPLLSGMENGVWTPRAVDVVISGNRPIAVVEHDATRLAAIDGRLSDLKGTAPAELMPVISDNWRSHFTWVGEGSMPPHEQAKLRRLATEAQAQQRRLRFWATPDQPRVWRELHAAGVDLIGTDDLAALQTFLLNEPHDQQLAE